MNTRRRDRISRAGNRSPKRKPIRAIRAAVRLLLVRGLLCELTGMAEIWVLLSQTTCSCSCGQLPKPNRETTRFSHTKRETRKPPFFAPILPTPHVVCYSHCISSDSAQFFCVFSRRSAGPPAPDPVLAAAPAGKRNAKKSGAQTKRQGGEIRLSRKLYKGGTFGLLFLVLVRGNDAGGAQAHLVRGRRRQRRKKTTALKWRDRTAGCAADGSRCRGLA